MPYNIAEPLLWAEGWRVVTIAGTSESFTTLVEIATVLNARD